MRSIFPTDDWMLAEGEINGKPLVIRMRHTMPSKVDQALFPRLIIISWDYEPNASGMPASDVYARMNELEDALHAGSEQRGVAYQAVSLTGDGKKEWRYYTSDTKQFLQSLNEDLAGRDPYPIEIREFEDPDWNGLAEYLTATEP